MAVVEDIARAVAWMAYESFVSDGPLGNRSLCLLSWGVPACCQHAVLAKKKKEKKPFYFAISDLKPKNVELDKEVHH